MAASIQITGVVSFSDLETYVFNKEAALSLIKSNIQANFGYLLAVLTSDTVINIDSSKAMILTGMFFIHY